MERCESQIVPTEILQRCHDERQTGQDAAGIEETHEKSGARGEGEQRGDGSGAGQQQDRPNIHATERNRNGMGRHRFAREPEHP